MKFSILALSLLLSNANAATYTGMMGFPQWWFEPSPFGVNEITNYTDIAYQILAELNGGFYPSLEGLSTTPRPLYFLYDPNVYGTDGYPIKLGDAAAARYNSGHPSWDVMTNEMAKNFWSASEFFNKVSSAGPFLKEASAVTSAEYVYQRVQKNYKKLGVSKEMLASLKNVFRDERAYRQARYDEYIEKGTPYSRDDTGDNPALLASQALSYEMLTTGDKLGWGRFAKFNRAFCPKVKDALNFWKDGITDSEASTYTVAALSFTFGRDLRERFEKLDFPVNDKLFNESTAALKQNGDGKCSIGSPLKP